MSTLQVRANRTDDFHDQLKAILPRLRFYALSLTHDRDRAGDLVQETVVKALTGRASFQPGTNFAGWMFRIQRNEFISSIRRQRPTVPIDTTISDSLTTRPTQGNGLMITEFLGAFGQLKPGQREALVMAVVEGLPYEKIAEQTGVSVGTVKSRVSRGRATLARLLLGGDDIRTTSHIVDGASAHSSRPRPPAMLPSASAADALESLTNIKRFRPSADIPR